MTTDGDPGLGRIFEDLEQQAAGLELAERDAELLDRAQGEYAGVTLAGRVHASVGRQVEVTLTGGLVVEGTLTAAGTGWCTITPAEPAVTWLVPTAAVALLRGASARSVAEPARPVTARLGFGSALRGLVADASEVVVHTVSEVPLRLRVLRVGADFAEVIDVGATDVRRSLVLPFAAVRAVRVG